AVGSLFLLPLQRSSSSSTSAVCGGGGSVAFQRCHSARSSSRCCGRSCERSCVSPGSSARSKSAVIELAAFAPLAASRGGAWTRWGAPRGPAQGWTPGGGGGKENRQHRKSCGARASLPARNGSRSTPSSFHAGSSATPASASAVGQTSSELTGRSYVRPAGR